MSEYKKQRTTKMWQGTYKRLKVLAAKRGVTFVQLIDDLVTNAEKNDAAMDGLEELGFDEFAKHMRKFWFGEGMDFERIAESAMGLGMDSPHMRRWLSELEKGKQDESKASRNGTQGWIDALGKAVANGDDNET